MKKKKINFSKFLVFSEEIPQNFQNILLVRRCNSMPSAIIRRRPSLKTIKEPYKTRGVRQRRYEVRKKILKI